MLGKRKRLTAKVLLPAVIVISTAIAAFGEGQFPIGYGASFKPQIIECGGVAKKSIFMQPPYQNAWGKVLGTYKLQLPDVPDLKLKMFVGLEDKAVSESGVRFEVFIGDKTLYELKVTKPDGWKTAQIDLSAYNGKKINLILAVDSLTSPDGDLAAIGEPKILSGGKVIFDLLALAEGAIQEVRLPEHKGGAEQEQSGQTIQVLVNQVAYDIAGPKRFTVQALPQIYNLQSEVKASTSLSTAGEFAIDRCVDNDESSYFWSNRGAKVGDYIQVDLGQVRPVYRILISQAPGDFVYKGKLQSSLDGKNFDDIAEVSSPSIDKKFSARSMRYVRLFATAEQNNWIQVSDFRAFTKDDETQINKQIKQWAASIRKNASKKFKVKSTDSGSVVYQGKLKFVGNIKDWENSRKWGNALYWTGDFSKLKKAGNYVIEVEMPEKTSSVSFAVGKDAVVKKLMPLCGISSFKGRRWKRGGWKSDAPYEGHPLLYCNGPGLYGFARAVDIGGDFWNAGETNALIDEARWGMKVMDHHHKIAKLAYDDINKHINLPEKPDGSQYPDPQWAGMGIAPLAILARADYLSEQERAHCLELAKRSWAFYRTHKFVEPGWGPVGYWYSSDEGDTLRSFRPMMHGLLLLADLEMYAAEADDRYLENAKINAAVIVRDWQIENKGLAQTWRMQIWQQGIAPGALAAYILHHPDKASTEVKQKLEKWAEYVTGDKAGMKSNPFGIYKWDENSFFNPYQNGHSWKSNLGTHDWWQGEDGRYITNAWAAFTAAKALDDPELRTLGYNFVNYICGVNPLGNTMIVKVGDRPAQRIYGLIGEDKGTIINGLVANSEEDNSPSFDRGWRTNEVWLPYNAWMVIALSEMIEY